MTAEPLTPAAAPEPVEDAERFRLLSSQLEMYARDLRKTLDAERERARELAHANAQLADAARLRHDFLRFVAHEMRTPLSAFAALELVDLSDPDEAETLLGFARDGYLRLREFIDRVVAYFQWLSRPPGDVEPGETDIEMLLRYLAQCDLRLQPPRGRVALVMETQHAPLVAGEMGPLSDALRILLDNAVKFSKRAPNVTIVLADDGDRVAIEIRDEGVGFPPERAASLGASFVASSPRPAQSGTGLSLALARSIIEAHRGTVTLSSPGPGLGCTARVTLPWAPPAA